MYKIVIESTKDAMNGICTAHSIAQALKAEHIKVDITENVGIIPIFVSYDSRVVDLYQLYRTKLELEELKQKNDIKPNK